MRKLPRIYTSNPYLAQLKVGVLSSCAVFGLLLARIIVSGSVVYLFLLWNIVLAWVAWGLGVWLVSVLKGKTILVYKVALSVVWLLFLPNTFYLLTDLIHAVFGYDKVGGFAGWQLPYIADTSIIFVDLAILMLATWVGWLLGIASMRTVYGYAKTKLSSSRSLTLVFILSASSGYGIYLGRVPRWNSWDVVHRPFSLLADIGDTFIHPFDHVEAYIFSGVFFVMINVVFWSFEILHLSRD